MKKVFSILFMVLFIIIISGCSRRISFNGKNTFTCTKSEVDSSFNTTTKFTFSYDETEKLDEFEGSITMVFNDSTSEKVMKTTMRLVKIAAKTSGLYYEQNEDENSMNIIISGSINKLASILKSIDPDAYIDAKLDEYKSNAIQEFTNEGYICIDN